MGSKSGARKRSRAYAHLIVDHVHTLELLERYIQREAGKLSGQAQYLPQITYVWEMNPIGGFQKVAEGVCTTPGTAPKKHDRVDEFGFFFRSSLTEEEQATVIVAHIGGDEGWQILIRDSGKSSRQQQNILKEAWQKLSKGWKRRNRNYDAQGNS